MNSGISRTILRILTLLALVSAAALAIAAQDGDPNSPTPVLLSENESTRALAQEPGKVRNIRDLARSTSQAFQPEGKLELFVTSLDLMEDEGANAFRVYGIDRNGHQFRFPVLALEPIEGSGGVYRVTILLKDEIGFWDQPAADGDIIIYLTWRGLSSNRVRLGIGQIGGEIKEDPSARPAPLGTKGDKAASRTNAPEDISYRWNGDRLRFAEQSSFGPNTTLDNKLRRVGIRSWINEQFAAQYPSAANPFPSNALQQTSVQTNCDGDQIVVVDLYPTCFRDTYSMYQPQTWFFKEAYYGDAQLKHRTVWALSQIWVTSGVEIQQGRHMVEYQKILANNAFGNYRDLMKQMTLSPAMGQYLDMSTSRLGAFNENYAREIMQLFTIGLFMLNPDGTLQRDAQNNPIPTYNQAGVDNLTRVLTGWRFCNPATTVCPNSVPSTVNYIDPMVVNSGQNTNNLANNYHDLTAKSLLNYPGSTATMNIVACGNCAVVQPTVPTTVTAFANIKTYADASLDQALDNIFNHPNVGPLISKNLIQQMVTSDPTPAYVARVAAKFNNNGFGVRGDMKAVIRAILLDPEARGDLKTDPNYGKLREPVLYATNFFRTFNVRALSGSGQTDGYMASAGGGFNNKVPEFTGMAQTPFFSPTVFNFFPPDYGVPGTTMIGPEFALMTTGTAIQRANFMNRFVFNATPITVDANTPAGLSLDFADLRDFVIADPTNNLMLDELNRRMLHGTLSAQNRSTIMTAVNSVAVSNPPTAAQALSRAQQALYLIATSSQYQVQR